MLLNSKFYDIKTNILLLIIFLLQFLFVSCIIQPNDSTNDGDNNDIVKHYQLVDSKELTNASDQYKRSDVITINNQLYLAMGKPTGYELYTINENLDLT